MITGSTNLMWALYNNYVPVWLQAGNPAFDTGGETKIVGFGFGAFMTGIILTFDNIAALFISPLTGLLSDSTHTRFGRRKPWIIGAAPFAIAAFVLIPVFALKIPPELNGQTELLKQHMIPFVITLFFMLLPLSIMMVPSFALVYDITPSKNRSMANAISAFVGGVLGIGGAIGGALLFESNPVLPFWIGGAIVAVVIVLTAVFIEEPEESDYLSTEVEGELNIKVILNTLRSLPKENAKSLWFLLLTMFFGWLAFSQLQAFLSSYGLSVLNMDISLAALLYPIAGLAFILGVFPAGIAGTRIGRKKSSIIGLTILSFIALLFFIFGNRTVVWMLLPIGGFFWAFTEVNIDPMVVDSASSDLVLGTYNGLMSVAKTLGFILGPMIGGFIVENLFEEPNYNNIWLIILISSVLAILAIRPVTIGEIKKEEITHDN